MKICCLSDMHGHLPPLGHLDFDVLVIAGDICPASNHSPHFQSTWLDGKFRRWLQSIGKPVFGIAGNHDLIFEQRPELVPGDLPWTYLQDSAATLPNGLRIWGSPWQPTFGQGWAFNLDERELAGKWSLIPDDTAVLVVHGPPFGVGDWVSGLGKWVPDRVKNVGSPSLRERIEAIQPELVVAGHIHGGYGVHKLGWSCVVNAAHCDDGYRPVNAPVVVEVTDLEGDE